MYHDNNDSVSLFKSTDVHNTHEKSTNHGITEEFKNAIDSIYEVFKKPAQIKKQLMSMFPNKEKDLFPSEQQLLNYLKYKRLKAGQKASFN